METTERTLEERAEDIRERLSDAQRAIAELRKSIDALRDTFRGIEADALELAWDGYGHDPRQEDVYCPECEDVSNAYLDAELSASTLGTLGAIFEALF